MEKDETKSFIDDVALLTQQERDIIRGVIMGFKLARNEAKYQSKKVQ